MKEELKFLENIKNHQSIQEFIKEKQIWIPEWWSDEEIKSLAIESWYEEFIQEEKSIVVEKRDAEAEAQKIIADKNKTFIGAWKVVSKVQEKIQFINNEFDDKINDLLEKYPLFERQQFTAKTILAKEVKAGRSSIYITKRVEFFKSIWVDITEEQFADKILAKANPWEWVYADLENERDLKIIQVKKEFEKIAEGQNKTI